MTFQDELQRATALLDSSLGVAGERERAQLRAEVLAVWHGTPEDLVGALWQDCASHLSQPTLLRAELAVALFGLQAESLEWAMWAFRQDWHRDHEALVSWVAREPRPEFVGDMMVAAMWRPSYLRGDDGRAMARKALHILEVMPGERATQALQVIADANIQLVSAEAARLLNRRLAHTP